MPYLQNYHGHPSVTAVYQATLAMTSHEAKVRFNAHNSHILSAGEEPELSELLATKRIWDQDYYYHLKDHITVRDLS